MPIYRWTLADCVAFWIFSFKSDAMMVLRACDELVVLVIENGLRLRVFTGNRDFILVIPHLAVGRRNSAGVNRCVTRFYQEKPTGNWSIFSSMDLFRFIFIRAMHCIIQQLTGRIQKQWRSNIPCKYLNKCMSPWMHNFVVPTPHIIKYFTTAWEPGGQTLVTYSLPLPPTPLSGKNVS